MSTQTHTHTHTTNREMKDLNVCSLDSQANSLTSKRLGIRGLPSIFYIRDNGKEVLKFEGSRSKTTVMNFAKTRGQGGMELSYYTQNPFGPLGSAKGHAISAIVRTIEMHTYLVEEQDLSWALAAVLVCTGVVSSSIITVLLLSWFLAPTVNR